jgi:hypothetical protein
VTRRASILILLAASMAVAGCGAQRTYAWRGYDEVLYAHYRNPQARQAYLERLRIIVETCEARGERMPPGLYAEYGYALYEEGRGDDAVIWFEKERDQWPESQALMDKMIRNAKMRRDGARPAGGGNP